MEENQKKKSGVGGFAVGLTIICILGLAIMGYFIYYLLNAREKDQEKMQALRNDISSIKASVVELSSKTNEEPTEPTEVETEEVATYNGTEYTFKYNKAWKELGVATAETVGSVNRRIGALQLETENKDRISVLKHANTTLEKYLEEHKKSYLNSTDEGGGFELITDEDYDGNELKGRIVVFEQLDIQCIAYLLEGKDCVYEIEYAGAEEDYEAVQDDVEAMVDSFTIK